MPGFRKKGAGVDVENVKILKDSCKMKILDLSQLVVWSVRHMCSDKAEFSFLQKKTAF